MHSLICSSVHLLHMISPCLLLNSIQQKCSMSKVALQMFFLVAGQQTVSTGRFLQRLLSKRFLAIPTSSLPPLLVIVSLQPNSRGCSSPPPSPQPPDTLNRQAIEGLLRLRFHDGAPEAAAVIQAEAIQAAHNALVWITIEVAYVPEQKPADPCPFVRHNYIATYPGCTVQVELVCRWNASKRSSASKLERSWNNCVTSACVASGGRGC